MCASVCVVVCVFKRVPVRVTFVSVFTCVSQSERIKGGDSVLLQVRSIWIKELSVRDEHLG